MQQPLSSQPSGRALLHVSVGQGTTQGISKALSNPRNTKISSQLPRFYFTTLSSVTLLTTERVPTPTQPLFPQ